LNSLCVFSTNDKLFLIIFSNNEGFGVTNCVKTLLPVGLFKLAIAPRSRNWKVLPDRGSPIWTIRKGGLITWFDCLAVFVTGSFFGGSSGEGFVSAKLLGFFFSFVIFFFSSSQRNEPSELPLPANIPFISHLSNCLPLKPFPDDISKLNLAQSPGFAQFFSLVSSYGIGLAWNLRSIFGMSFFSHIG